MHSLIYISTGIGDLSEADLDQLAGAAAANNAAWGITGMLAYNGRHFMQLLEGERGRIDALTESIARDTRHRDMAIIRRCDNAQRECPDWSMRSFMLSLIQPGDAARLTRDLPGSCSPDTKMLFTSLASIAGN